jgi:hypothetical protein
MYCIELNGIETIEIYELGAALLSESFGIICRFQSSFFIVTDQGDLIGRILAYWVIFNFGAVF